MSLIQKEISDFSVQCYQNNAFHAVTKADVLGKWSVFFFYPADFTFVCPTELEDLANLYDKFQAIGCEIYSVSCDTHFVHKAWHDASERIQKIQYPMLADPTHCLAKDFEVYIEADGMAERGSFIVNPEGKIVAYEVNAGNVGRNADELLRKVQACQFVAEHGDEVCPAKAARLQSVGPSTAQPFRLVIHFCTCFVSRERPPIRPQRSSRLPRALRASTATRTPSRDVSALAADRPEMSVRRSTCLAPAVRAEPSRRVSVTAPATQNSASKCRGSSQSGKGTGPSSRANRQARTPGITCVHFPWSVKISASIPTPPLSANLCPGCLPPEQPFLYPWFFPNLPYVITCG